MVLSTLSARRRSRRSRDDDLGMVAVLVAVVVLAVIMPLLAIVVDLGLTRVLSRQSQGAADAAALAAVQPLHQSSPDPVAAVTAAENLVSANLPPPSGGWPAAWNSCIAVDPLPTSAIPGGCISYDMITKRVRVTVPERTVPTIFSGVLRSSPPAASATSTASWGSDPTIPCGLCVSGDYAGGRRRVEVDNGNVAIGDTLSFGGPGGSLTAPNGSVSTATTVADPFAASLATLRTQTPNGLSVYGQVSTLPPDPACDPGIYQDISACTSFSAGTYFVTGNGSGLTQVRLYGDASAGVLLYFTCSASSGFQVLAAACPATGGSTFRGAGSAQALTAPNGGADLALVFDSGLTGPQPFIGTPLTINGSVYAPDATFTNPRSSRFTTRVAGGSVMAKAVSVSSSNRGAGILVLTVDATPVNPQPVLDGPVRLVPND